MSSILKEIVEKVFGDDFDEEILTPEVREQNDKVVELEHKMNAMLNAEQQEIFRQTMNETIYRHVLTQDESVLGAFRKGILFGLELSEYYRK